MKKVLFVFLLSLFSITILAQDANHEVNSEVKELKDFHTVIYKLWHTAWPNKDIKMLHALLPDIEKGTQSISAAKLPGILREKQTKWESGVAELSKLVVDYKSATTNKDSVALLDVAEKLHAKYEGLVRIIRPVLKEVDQFHQELYLVYHYYMPENKSEKILASAKVLESKMTDLKNAKLPERLSGKKADFDKAVLELDSAVKKLNEVTAAKGDKKTVDAAVLLVHTKYQDIEKIFN